MINDCYALQSLFLVCPEQLNYPIVLQKNPLGQVRCVTQGSASVNFYDPAYFVEIIILQSARGM